jgi:hypothetical protein
MFAITQQILYMCSNVKKIKKIKIKYDLKRYTSFDKRKKRIETRQKERMNKSYDTKQD